LKGLGCSKYIAMKNVLITGGSSGIGLAIAAKLVEAGGWKVISVSRNPEKIDRGLQLHPNLKNKVDFQIADVSEEEQCDRVFEYLNENYKTLHGLVNNAALLTSGGIFDLGFDEWNKSLKVNLSGPFYLTRKLLPLLVAADDASVLNISSIASKTPGRSIAYSVSKAGLDMLTEFLAGELGPFGIRVNAINPGLVETNLHLDSKVFDDPEKYRSMLEKSKADYPVGRIGKPEDIAQLAEFLLSGKSSWITGSIIRIDGGTSVLNQILPQKKKPL
jgi:NAD(P)-dependent dehydrogenase (short-subunit alcohol dehydrogenase family)